MVLYVCNNCKEILSEAIMTSEKIQKICLVNLKVIPSTKKLAHNPYQHQLIKEELLSITCPRCGDKVTEIQVTEENFIAVWEVLKNSNIENVWETIFDILL